MKERTFKITLKVNDGEEPNMTNEEAADALKAYLLEQLENLSLEILQYEVVCE